MKGIKKYLPWSIRIFVFLLFMVSAISKMFPIWQFEKQVVDLGLMSWCQAHYFARLMIACEFATGIAFLQPHFLKRIIIPCAILLLAVFSVHLVIQIYLYGGMSGNCGCFGQLIPMTPIEALIKNIVLIGMLVYLFLNVKEKEKGKNNFFYLLLIGVSCTAFMFMVSPFCPCKEKAPVSLDEGGEMIGDSTQVVETPKDTLIQEINTMQFVVVVDDNVETGRVPSLQAKNDDTTPTPTPTVHSKFTPYQAFGNRRVNLDEGEKIVCLFAAGCDHCRATAKELCQMSKEGILPEMFILFMNEETNLIPDFFTEAECRFPYRIVDISEFWGLLGAGNTPGVFYLRNGKIVKEFEGIEKNAFNKELLKKAISAK